MDYNPYVNISR